MGYLRDSLCFDNWKFDKIGSYEYSSLIIWVSYVNTSLMFQKLTFKNFFGLRSARGHGQLLVPLQSTSSKW